MLKDCSNVTTCLDVGVTKWNLKPTLYLGSALTLSTFCVDQVSASFHGHAPLSSTSYHFHICSSCRTYRCNSSSAYPKKRRGRRPQQWTDRWGPVLVKPWRASQYLMTPWIFDLKFASHVWRKDHRMFEGRLTNQKGKVRASSGNASVKHPMEDNCSLNWIKTILDDTSTHSFMVISFTSIRWESPECRKVAHCISKVSYLPGSRSTIPPQFR